MRILILNSILYTAENNILPKVKSIKDCMIYNFALGFVQMNHDVTLVAAEDYKPTLSEEYDFEVVFLKSNFKSVFKIGLLPLHLSLWTFLQKRKNSFDLVISSESFSFNSLFSSLILPSKLIIWQELFNHNRLYFKLPSLFWYNIVVRFLYSKAYIIPRSEKAKNFISQFANNVSPECVEHGINIDNYIVKEEKKDQFVVVSQLILRKRIDIIIKHFVKFIKTSSKHSHFKLIIIGRGNIENSLKDLVSKLKVEDSVLFYGFLSHKELCPIVAQSKALLIDTEKDMNMVSIPEAIAGGTPILTNTVPSNSYYIKNNLLGIVKDEWDESDLINIVKNNNIYVSNCHKYKHKLSNTYIANKLLKIFYSHTKRCLT